MRFFAIYVLTAIAEIAGCYALWAWHRPGKSLLWLGPGVAARNDPYQAARGPNRIIPAPTRQIATPIKSQRSGRAPSTAQSQPRAAAM